MKDGVFPGSYKASNQGSKLRGDWDMMYQRTMICFKLVSTRCAGGEEAEISHQSLEEWLVVGITGKISVGLRTGDAV
jgi:hypothetical protein